MVLMKMNRGHSGDSLDNGIGDIISSGSSSPTDFTSDDETSADNLFMMSGQAINNKPRSRLSETGQVNKVDKYPSPHMNYYRVEYPFQARHNILQTSASYRPVLGPNSQSHLSSSQLGYIDHCAIEPSIASTSYYDNVESNHLESNIDLLSSRIPDVVPDPASIALLPDQAYGNRCNNQIDNVGSHRQLARHRRVQASHSRSHASNTLGGNENGENLADEENDSDLFGRSDSRIEPAVQALAGPSRGMNTIAVRMCARLVECRSLIEAIEFIEQNRDLIDSLTRIVTRDAPAFRNYDMSNYQIDYSVKESFNPHFWHDREPIVTTADGNCQYHAVSLSLTGSEAYTQEVRLATAMAVVDNREWFDSMLKLIDRGTVLDLVHTIARSYSWGDETTLKAIAVAIKRRIFLYTCNIGKKDYEMVKSLSKEELLDAFKEKKYRGGTGIHTYADPLTHVSVNNYIMLFHKSEHFIAVLPTSQQPTMFEPYNPIVPVFS